MNTSADIDLLEDALNDAHKRWRQLDVVGSGYLEGDELEGLIKFVLSIVVSEASQRILTITLTLSR